MYIQIKEKGLIDRLIELDFKIEYWHLSNKDICLLNIKGTNEFEQFLFSIQEPITLTRNRVEFQDAKYSYYELSIKENE